MRWVGATKLINLLVEIIGNERLNKITCTVHATMLMLSSHGETTFNIVCVCVYRARLLCFRKYRDLCALKLFSTMGHPIQRLAMLDMIYNVRTI